MVIVWEDGIYTVACACGWTERITRLVPAEDTAVHHKARCAGLDLDVALRSKAHLSRQFEEEAK